MIPASAFAQVAPNRWSVTLSSERPINELVAFITQPLSDGSALGCHIASAPFEQQSWHYLGAISNESPSTVFKTRLVWSARDAVPTCVQFGVELTPATELAQVPAEKASAEVIEAGRRVGLDLYEYISSFATNVALAGGGSAIQLPSNVIERWLSRFNDKCKREGFDWLSSVGS
uniref:Hikeshi-like N-terminal domain-containing protein n=1 Tax=Coccolithus braarudii TaxID=221442 RepID=A0A7S0LDK8_9EUKA